MVYEAACRYFNQPVIWQPDGALDEIEGEITSMNEEGNYISDAILNAYDIRMDDAALRKGFDSDDPAKHFANLRNNYNYRREFSAYKLIDSGKIPREIRDVLSTLGFLLS